MSFKTHSLLPGLLLPLLLTLPAPARGELADRVLGDGGELYQIEAGSYGDLFPGGGQLDPETPILAITVRNADGTVDTLRVPGTGGPRVESAPGLLAEPRSGSLIALWRSEPPAGGDFRLHFATRNADGWSEAITVSDAGGAPLLFAEPPKMAVTRDLFDLEVAGADPLRASRTAVHLLHHAGGATLYTPLIFVDGVYLGWHQSLDLGATFLLPGENDPEPPALTPELAAATTLQVSDEDRTVIATFANPASGRLGAVEIALLPLELEVLGDHVRDQILDHPELYDPSDLSDLIDKMQAEIIVIGARLNFHPGILDYVSTELGGWLDEEGGSYGAEELQALSEDSRQLAIDLSSQVAVTVVEDPGTGEEIYDIDLGNFFDPLNGTPLGRILEVEVLADRAAPATGPGPTRLLSSHDGGDLLVGWHDAGAGQIHYRESRRHLEGGAWSEVRSLAVGGELDEASAWELLGRKIR
jgi:hypothetical protein